MRLQYTSMGDLYRLDKHRQADSCTIETYLQVHIIRLLHPL